MWIGREAAKELRSTYAPAPSTQRAVTSPSMESERAEVVTRLRKQLVVECGETPPPALAFERWLLDSLLVEEMSATSKLDKSTSTTTTTNNNNNNNNNTTLNDNSNDPLFGPLCRRTDLESSSLVSDLIRASVLPQDALLVATNLQTRARDMMIAVRRSSTPLKSKKKRMRPTSVSVIFHRHTIDVTFGVKSKRLLKLNHEHYDKLFSLWRISANGGNNGGNDGGDSDSDLQSGGLTQAKSGGSSGGEKKLKSGGTSLVEDQEKAAFHDDLFILLSRYFAMQGHGFQAACPESVFIVLHRLLGVSFECFASPLNCFYGAYCSAFTDVDASFGSSGSFWNWQPPVEGGSFQANPPFVAIIMKCMAEKILDLLVNSEQREEARFSSSSLTSLSSSSPLSFVIIVPGWLEDEGYRLMSSCQYIKAHWMIAQQEHGFCDGAQHQRRDRYRSSPYDTAVFVLQNDAGAAKWPITRGAATSGGAANLETELRKAFATGVPTESAVARRKRDGRGFGDEDGGGGVYKGRKKRRTGEGVVERRRQESQSKKKKNPKKKKFKKKKKK